jgi:hypothetical protein
MRTGIIVQGKNNTAKERMEGSKKERDSKAQTKN